VGRCSTASGEAVLDDRLAAYVRLVELWAPRLDLVSTRDLERFRSRHVADSLRLVPLERSLPPGPGIDVGSGAGLPGVPLALSSERPWRLLERRRGRAAFLEEVVRVLELDRCEVVVADAHVAVKRADLRGAHALAVARALAGARVAFDLLRGFVRGGGVAAYLVGESTRVPAEATLWAEGVAIIRVADEPG
jgi:16S rRNA (guanine(527)-N(7))-methyltransferase RsmG